MNAADSAAVDPACSEVAALLPLIADGVMDVVSDPAVFAHLARCVDCQAALAAHDLATLALAGHGASAPRRTFTVVHYQVPLPYALAGAAAVLAALGLGWRFAQPQTEPSALARTTVPGPAVVDREVIRLVQPDQPERPVYVIRQGDRTMVVDLGAVDGRGRPPARAIPVALSGD